MGAVVIRKFLFDRRFDGSEEADAAEAPPPEVIPVYGVEDLEQARADGFAQGAEHARTEAAASLEQRLATTVDRLLESAAGLLRATDEQLATMGHDALHLAVAIAAKVLPDLHQRHGLNEIEQLVASVMGRLMDPTALVVRVHPTFAGPLEERLSVKAAAQGLAGRLAVQPADDLAPGDCTLEWGGGGAVRTFDYLWENVDQLITGAIGTPSRTAIPTPSPPTEDGPSEDTGAAQTPPPPTGARHG